MRIFKAKERDFWHLRSGWAEKDTIRQAGGWRWDWDKKRWWTASEQAVRALFRLTGELRVEDEGAEDGPRLLDLAVEESFVGHPSMALDTDYDPPCRDGLAYLPFQKAGIEFALRKFGFFDRNAEETTRGNDETKGSNGPSQSAGVLIADEMGL